MTQLHIWGSRGPGPGADPIEIVERKGLGHPDTICDLVMDRVSRALCAAYVETFGAVLHHNCDKGLLAAGAVEHRLGGGRVLEAMRLVVGDRATAEAGGRRIDVEEIAVEAARAWFRESLRHVDPVRDLRIDVALRAGSEQLRALFAEGDGTVAGANDTSAAVGFAPLTPTETLVIETERYLNSAEFHAVFPEAGEDVKVMGVRRRGELDLTVAMPLVDRHVDSEAAYFRRIDDARTALEARLASRFAAFERVHVRLNALDRRGRGLEGMYLTVIGTSAEDADSGEVGRGNRVNGLICLNRPASSEAAAGKNPVSHVGKIYNVLTHLLAARIHEAVDGVAGATVWLASRIGEPVDRPATAGVALDLGEGAALEDVRPQVDEVVGRELARVPALCRELAEGRHAVC